jgi:hypothetical protein
MKLFPLLDEYELRVEELATSVVCAARQRDDVWRSPSFTTLCGRVAKWPGHGEIAQASTVTCIRCWERVLPGET